MKKNLLSFILCFVSSYLFSQTDQLYVNGPIHVGMDIGFSYNGYFPIGIHFSSYNTKFQFGITAGISMDCTKAEGEHYSNINWDQFPEDVIDEGSYYTPFTFDVGYKVFGGFVVGFGIGYSTKTIYRNMFDEFHILGHNGCYNISIRGEGSPEYKGYISYYFPSNSDNVGSVYVKGSYYRIMGLGVSMGVTF